MNRLFGSTAAKAKKPTLDDALAGNETRIDGLEVKIRKLDAELGRHRDQLKRLRDGPGKQAVQQKALRVLKQRKMCAELSVAFVWTDERTTHRYEAQRDQLQQQSYNMEQASMTTENLRNTMATVDAMKTANKEMKRQYGKLDVDKIEVRCPSRSGFR